MNSRFFILILLLIAFDCDSQAQDLQVSLLASGNYSKHKYKEKRSYSKKESGLKAPLGYSIKIQAEQKIGGMISWFGAVGYKQKKYQPKDGFTWDDPYGDQIFFITEGPYNANPESHRFHLLSFPIGLKLEPWDTERMNTYFTLGIETDFRFSVTEIYGDNSYQYLYLGHRLRKDDPRSVEKYSTKDNTPAYFGTALTFGMGVQIRLNKTYTMLIHNQFNVLEYREGYTSFYPGEVRLWNNSFLMMGQFSGGLGVQRSF